jgi:predicted RNase H-like nuclease
VSDEPVAVGVDGYKGGWIAALAFRTADGTKTGLKHFGTVGELARWRNGLGSKPFVTIDVPIGLPESTGFRRCDKEARRHLGKRRNSVFMPPGRYLLAAKDFDEARRLVEERRLQEPDAKGIGAQAWGIVPKIREVDEFLRVEPKRQEWLLEVHPEICFLCWSGCLLRVKQSAAGQVERLDLVREEFPDVERAIVEDLSEGSEVALTDVLDAYAALWTALRRSTDNHKLLAEQTSGGLRAAMIV